MANRYVTDYGSSLFAIKNINEIYQKRIRIERTRSQLETERSSFISTWKEANDFVAPRRGRFFVSDTNRGDRRNQNIIDTSPVFASRTLTAAMMSGVTSPSRPWFRLGSQELEDNISNKQWLHSATKAMQDAFARSNLYKVLPVVYRDMHTFATGCAIIEDDPDTVFRFVPVPVGSYMIAQGPDLRVNTFIREFQMTANQVVDKFGRDPDMPKNIDWSNISEAVRSLYNSGSGETWVDIVHAILPNTEYDPTRMESKYKKFSSIYYERGNYGKGRTGTASDGGSSADRYKILRESGFDYFPVFCPRWEITGEDVYGTDCPAITAMGDIKQLQEVEKRSLQAVEKKIFPDMKAPAEIKGQGKPDSSPGPVTYLPKGVDPGSYGPSFQVNFNEKDAEFKQEQVRQRIFKAFYVDTILSITQSQRQQTAREVEEKSSEKLLVFGPVLEQLNQDMLDPLIDIAFAKLLDAGNIPQPPPELAGKEIKVEYISVMAQAQKLVGVGNIEQFTGFVSNLAAVTPRALDKLNVDQIVEDYGEATSVSPDVLHDEEHVSAERQKRMEEIEARNQAEMAQMGAQTAKTLGEVDNSNLEAEATDLALGGL